jgi:type VI secretion system protein ImpH
MDRQRYDALQPGGPAAAALQALLKFAVGHNLAVDVCLVLQKQAVPPARLAATMPCGWAELLAGCATARPG